MMWQVSGAPADLEDVMLKDKQVAQALHSEVQCLIHAMQTEDNEAQQNAASLMIEVTAGWMIRRWSESNVVKGNPLV